MADKRKKCKVCKHKKVALIDKKLRNGDSVNSIHKLFGVSRNTLSYHRDNCLTTLLMEDKEVQDSLLSDKLINQVNDQIALVQKMILACDDYLSDPEDPDKYYLGPRGDEVDIVYNEIDEETGRLLPSQRKATLQELLQSVESGSYVVRGITHKHADPRDLLLKAIAKLETTAKFIYEGSQKLIEWEYKKQAMDKVSKEGGTISFEKQVETITERVTIAMRESNTEELSKLAELPELK